MTLTRSHRGVGRTTPWVQTLTGPIEGVLYAVGYARRVGALVSVDDPVERGDGTVSVRVQHTLLVPLALPTHLTPLAPGRYRDRMDYLEAVLRALPWLLGGGITLAVYELIHQFLDFVGVHGHDIAAGIGAVVVVILVLCFLKRGGSGCGGVHCGGCKG